MGSMRHSEHFQGSKKLGIVAVWVSRIIVGRGFSKIAGHANIK